MKPIIARWESWSGEGAEHLVLRREGADIAAEAVVVGPAGDPFAAWYRVLCDADWQVRDVRVAVIGKERALELRADGAGRWQDEDGMPLHAIQGAIDVDLSATPFTNTLPIRRLDLRPGQSAEIEVAYVRLPDLAVARDRQRYTRLDATHYRFASPEADFVRDIEVDEHGLVVVYPGLFRRVA